MKKILAAALAVVCLASLFAMPTTVSADALSKKFDSALGGLAEYYEYGTYYMALHAASPHMNYQDWSTPVIVPGDEFEKHLYDHFVIDEATVEEIRATGYPFARYNREDHTYAVTPVGGRGGSLPDYEYGGYVCHGDTYDVYFQIISYKNLKNVYDEEMPLEEYLELYGIKSDSGRVMEVEYKGESYRFIGLGGGYYVVSYLSEGKKYTVEMNGDIVRIISAGTFDSLPEAFDDDIYPDVAEGTWYYDAVKYVSKKGWMTGYANGLFGPADRIQRQDFVVMLARIHGVSLNRYTGQTGGLSDVDPNAYYASAIAWAVEKGYITGYENGKFGVGDPMNREQVATILYRYKGKPAVENADATLSTFPDAAKISAFAKDAMAWANQEGLITGMANGTVSPHAVASRAQIATIIKRMYTA